MDRADGIAVFVAVAEQGGFAKAARRLGRSPASVTRAVADLEARLGIRLLNRTTRAVSLTEVGQRFLDGATRVLADFDEIERAAAGQSVAPRGALTVTAPIVFGRLHVLPIVTEFLAAYPAVSARLMLIDRTVDLVEEALDVAIRIGALADSSAVATQVGAVAQIVVASPTYLARRGAPKMPGDLASHDIVAFAGISGDERWVFDTETIVPVRPRLIVTTAEAAVDAAIGGFGVTRVLGYQAAHALAAGSLVRLLRAHEGEALPIHLLYPGGRHSAAKLRAFVDFAVPRLRRQCERILRPE